MTDPVNISVSSVAYNGYIDGTRVPFGIWVPGAPPGPIQTSVQISDVGGRVLVWAQGTFYPSLEIWRYGPAGPQLVYFYNALGLGQEGLARTGNLYNVVGSFAGK